MPRRRAGRVWPEATGGLITDQPARAGGRKGAIVIGGLDLIHRALAIGRQAAEVGPVEATNQPGQGQQDVAVMAKAQGFFVV